MIVVDTSLLSLVFRRPRAIPMRAAVMLFEQLVVARQAIAIPSIVLQELLSGVRDEDAVGKLEAALGGYALLLPARDTHLLAAQLQRRYCRYDAPLPVLNNTTSDARAIVPSCTASWSTERAQPPSGAATMPVASESLRVQDPMASSLAVPATPPASRNTLSNNRSPSGDGTRRPLA